jgi:hypothetical protein
LALQDYARLVLFVDGTYISQLTSLESEHDSGQQPVNLLNEGLAGFTPGAGHVNVTIGYAVPIGGPEFDYTGKLVVGEYVDLQIGQGSKSFAGRGKITNARHSQSTGGALEGSATWMGELQPYS